MLDDEEQATTLKRCWWPCSRMPSARQALAGAAEMGATHRRAVLVQTGAAGAGLLLVSRPWAWLCCRSAMVRGWDILHAMARQRHKIASIRCRGPHLGRCGGSPACKGAGRVSAIQNSPPTMRGTSCTHTYAYACSPILPCAMAHSSPPPCISNRTQRALLGHAPKI